MDEKGLMMGVVLQYKVIVQKGPWAAKLPKNGSREWVTVIEAISGDGRLLHPVVINKGKAHYMGWYAKLQKMDVTTFGVLEKQWSNELLGLRWLKKIFNRETQESAGNSYRLLSLDGDVSYFNCEFFDYCLNAKIIPFCLPAHSTHLLQPLDVGIFGPLQRHYSNGLDEFI
ncbi:CENP-B protein [Tuber magnatum]|uniref:CENP-B protein n=1 Tax=Tuber magnatum TaxID=42249 RepID=A0A317SPM1_9PEZI|nr:CENP-B protein [Tuber magnatum]